ncbi:MAG: metalloregulator ArsR/SmtB family transcription factor [Micrococcales bacterium]|nr:metalloregulator ArsR/SmtB family transcription factor [Micrococcales bacterium]MCL2667966.1 metalloregulator ArsR/SmtB family transcription factor [Micrococcales bacterium]
MTMLRGDVDPERNQPVARGFEGEERVGARLHSHAGVEGHAHAEVVQLLRALAEPARLSVVHLLAEAPRRVTDMTAVLGLAQSTVSGHLAVLREAGLVTATPQGRATWYALVDAEVDGLLGAAERVVTRLAAS